MKKLIYVLLIGFMFIGCDLFGSKEPEKPIAEIHIPMGNATTSRRIYNFSDVNEFTITLQGEDIDGNSVYEFCGDYDYDTTNDEIVIYIKKSGYYFVEVAANKKLSDDTNKVIATGKSGAFRVIDGDVKTIVIDMKYEYSNEITTSTLYRIYNGDIKSIETISIVFDESISSSSVDNYVSTLKENTTNYNWWQNWNKTDIGSIDTDYVKMFYHKDNFLESAYYVEKGVYQYKYVYVDENAMNYVINKNIDSDYDNFRSIKTMDFIYITDNNDNLVEKIAYYIGTDKKSVIDFIELKDLGTGKGEDWVYGSNPFDNIVSIDFSDTTTDGGIQINW